MQTQEIQKISSQVRRDILRMVHACQSGHPGGSLGCTDLLVDLFFSTMNLKTDAAGKVVFDMDGKNEDLFFLSNGHISPLIYSVLARRGYFATAELASFRKIKKLNGDSSTVYCLMGDGEQNEGQVWEAAMYAPHHKVDNLIAFIDENGQQIDGPTEKVMSNRDLQAKYQAFGWNVMRMDGNDATDIQNTLIKAKAALGQGSPIMIIMKTEMGAGVDFMMYSHKWHGVAPNDQQLEDALVQLEETLGDY
jgi:transketolase